jgi:hypothetical protein
MDLRWIVNARVLNFRDASEMNFVPRLGSQPLLIVLWTGAGWGLGQGAFLDPVVIVLLKPM